MHDMVNYLVDNLGYTRYVGCFIAKKVTLKYVLLILEEQIYEEPPTIFVSHLILNKTTSGRA